MSTRPCLLIARSHGWSVARRCRPCRLSVHFTGFTLIEVLVAIALILALVGTMYGFLFDMLSARRRVIEHVWQETAASALIKQLDADLHTCIVGDSVSGSGVQGTATRIRILSRSVAASLAGRGVDDPDVFGDLQLAEFRFDEANHRIEGRRGPAQSGSDASLPFAPLEGSVHRVRFRYHDGQQWLREFDSRDNSHLPLAVEVRVWYRGESNDQDQVPQPAADATTDEEALASDVTESILDEGSDIAPDPVDDDERSLPPPDRVRIIAIPDARDHEIAVDEESPP